MFITAYLLLVPLAVIFLARRWKWINTISPMTVLYIIGLLVANLLPLDPKTVALNNSIGSVAIPFAIPLMLMGCNTHIWNTGKAAKVFFSGLLAVIIVVIAGYFIFRGSYDDQSFAQVSAVATGLYTGGIPNVGAIAKGVGINQELYLYITSYDLIITGLYLVFVIFFGKPVFRSLLPTGIKEIAPTEKTPVRQDTASTQTKGRFSDLAVTLLLVLIIVGLSYGVATLASSDGGVNMTILILTLTTLAIAASFLKPVGRQTQSFDIGLYCVYVFCLSIATACDIKEMNLLGSLNILAYIAFVIFGSLVLQVLFAKILKIDGDSVLVCSVALINSPPFVPMVAAILNNKDIVVLGITVGLLGYMLGNYLGIGIFELLQALP